MLRVHYSIKLTSCVGFFAFLNSSFSRMFPVPTVTESYLLKKFDVMMMIQIFQWLSISRVNELSSFSLTGAVKHRTLSGNYEIFFDFPSRECQRLSSDLHTLHMQQISHFIIYSHLCDVHWLELSEILNFSLAFNSML